MDHLPPYLGTDEARQQMSALLSSGTLHHQQTLPVHVHVQGNAFEYGQEEAFAARYPFLSSPQDRGLLLAHGAKLMLYQPPSVRAPSSALQAAQQAQQAQPMEVDGPPPPPPGMSRADVAAVEGKQPPPGGPRLRPGAAWALGACQPTQSAAVLLHPNPCWAMQARSVIVSLGPSLYPWCYTPWPRTSSRAPLPRASAAADALLRRKLGLLNFSAAAGMDPAEMLLVYLAAACDPDDQVCGGCFLMKCGNITGIGGPGWRGSSDTRLVLSCGRLPCVGLLRPPQALAQGWGAPC